MIDKKFWENRNVLVTGHTGFKGSWLCLWLNKIGANVSGLSLLKPVSTPNLYSTIEIGKSVNDARGDIVHFNDCLNVVKKVKPNIIFHLAAQPLVRESYLNPLNTYKTNIIGTANILEAAHVYGNVQSIVVITSDKCYENYENDHAFKESDRLGGHDPYSSSKACSEHVSSAYYRSFFKKDGIGLASARAGNVIGGGDWSDYRLIPDAVKTWSNNNKLIIRYPDAIRPWQHVLEPLLGYIILAEMLSENPDSYSSAWNFGPNQSSFKTVKDVVEQAASVWGEYSDWDVSQDEFFHESGLLQLNSEKAYNLLGWRPRMDFEESVSATIKWYKEFYSNNRNMKAFTLAQIKNFEDTFDND